MSTFLNTDKCYVISMGVWAIEALALRRNSDYAFRYVQTALILSITPAKYLHHCYELLKRRGSYFDNLFGESATFDSIEPVTILPPWWPGDWWRHTLETVAEHFERIAPTAMPTEALSLQRMLPPLTAHSLRPLFHLVSLDLEEANPYTHCQVLRLHLRLIGVKPMLLRCVFHTHRTSLLTFVPLRRGAGAPKAQPWTTHGILDVLRIT